MSLYLTNIIGYELQNPVSCGILIRKEQFLCTKKKKKKISILNKGYKNNLTQIIF